MEREKKIANENIGNQIAEPEIIQNSISTENPVLYRFTMKNYIQYSNSLYPFCNANMYM